MAGQDGRQSRVQHQTLMGGGCKLSRRMISHSNHQAKLLGLATWKPLVASVGMPPIVSSRVVLGRAVFGAAQARMAMKTDPTLERWVSLAMTLLSGGTGCI